MRRTPPVAHPRALNLLGRPFRRGPASESKRPEFSQTRCLVSVFLLSYSRLGSSPSTWKCAPLVSVFANSESFLKTTQRCHSVCEMYLSFFL